MDGFISNPRTGGSFITTFKGKFCLKCDAGTPGSVKRLNKNNKEVTELQFDRFIGHVTSLKKEDHPEYGLNWKIGLHTKEKDYTLTVPFGGTMMLSLSSRLFNTDLAKQILIGIFESEGTDKKLRTLFFVYENPYEEDGIWKGTKVLPLWSRKEPGDLPEMKAVKRRGKDEWDDTERMEFIESFANEYIIPNLPKFAPDQFAKEGVHDDTEDKGESAPKEKKKAPLPSWLNKNKPATGSGQAPAPVKNQKPAEPVLPDNSPTDDLPF